MTKDEADKAADEMMRLLDLATLAMQDDDLKRALDLIAKVHAIADTLPIKKDVYPNKSGEGRR
jgi:hypothetical protein